MEKDKNSKKPMTYKEAIEALGDLIGTQAPIVEIDSFRKTLSTIGNQDEQVPPDIQDKVEELQKRTKDATKKSS